MPNLRFSSLASACLFLMVSACDNGGPVPVQDMPSAPNDSPGTQAPDGPPATVDPSLAFVCEAPRPDSLSNAYNAAGCDSCHGPQGNAPSLTDGFATFSDYEHPIRNGQGRMPAISEGAYPDEALRNDLAYLVHPIACGNPGANSSASSAASSLSQASSIASSSSSSASSIDPNAPVTDGPEGAYSFCVNEAEWDGDTRPEPSVCEFEGTREVYFGANGQFRSTPATGSIICTTDSFGEDPIPNVRKACFISDSVVVAPGSSAASSAPSSVAASSSSLASSSVAASSSSEASSSSAASSSVSSSSSSEASSSSVESSSSSSAPTSSSSLASSSSSSAASQPSDFVCDAPKPATVSSYFTATCSGCHGTSGEGDAFRAINNFEVFENFENGIRMGTPSPLMNPYSEAQYSQSDVLNDFAFIHYDSRCGTTTQQLAINSCDLSEEDFAPRLIALTETQLLNTLAAVFEGFDGHALPATDESTSDLKVLGPTALELPEIELEQWQALQATLNAAAVQLSQMLAQDCEAASRPDCSDWLLAEYAPQLWRRPVSDREFLELTDALNAQRSQGADPSEQIVYALQSLLVSPNFLFRTELGDRETHPHLGAYEIASRLSYSLWHSSPDAELYELAANSQLSDAAVINAQVERMIADARFQGTLDGLISSEFLTMEEMLDPNKQLYGLGIEAPSEQACRVDWEG